MALAVEDVELLEAGVSVADSVCCASVVSSLEGWCADSSVDSVASSSDCDSDW